MSLRKRLCACAVSCILACALALAGCAAPEQPKYADSEYLGTWTAVKAKAYGVTVQASEFLERFTVELAEDGTATVTVNDETGVGTWEETEKGVRLAGAVSDGGGDEFEFASKKGKLVVKYSGATITFERQ